MRAARVIPGSAVIDSSLPGLSPTVKQNQGTSWLS